MTAEEIRTEAIERAAKALAALECPGPPVERHYATAEAMIDALGDMLPTRRQWAARRHAGGYIDRLTSDHREDVECYRGTTFYDQPVVIESQWTHEWREVTD